MSETDGRREKIIEAALKRFSHFGISKTTMNEIAEDLNISKALLYYYFPDKNSLFLEVAKDIFSAQLEAQSKVLLAARNVPEGLMNMIDVRISFGEKFYMMKIQDLQIEHLISDKRFSELRNEVKDKENILVADFLDEGIRKGELKEIDTEKTAYVLNSIFLGMGMSEVYLCAGPSSLTLSPELIASFTEKVRDAILLVYEGIKK